MNQDRLKIAFVGHVDHGKSTLIGRLLYDTDCVPPDRMEMIRKASEEQGRDVEFAFLMDHLKEEREKGITIDTAQIFFRAADREFCIIDAPGHREFLKNMLTGASQADAAVLIVDLREGIREQTQRHAFLLGLLGVKDCVIAMNKMDLVGFDEKVYQTVKKELGSFLKRIGARPLAFVPISAKHGDNVVNRSDRMPWHNGPTIIEALNTIKAVTEENLPARVCVQDVYRFDGKRLAAARIESGLLNAGDEVLILPDKVRTKVASIERFKSSRATAEPGECVALVLPDDVECRRGQILCDPSHAPEAFQRITVRLFWMSEAPLNKGDILILKALTQESPCEVLEIAKRINSSSLEVLEELSDRLENTEVAETMVSLSAPVVVELAERNPALGRVVLERGGSVHGAGIVIGTG
ncbi:MAG TPA: GTP-binding protein [Candidatus Brocadiia bacterium]|nr:GTP-binding protein [Candidatus Brocadiia bacterium]